jgi:glycine cleavage system regulatory protein
LKTKIQLISSKIVILFGLLLAILATIDNTSSRTNAEVRSMQQLVLTVIGQDKKGLVNQLSKICLENEANWMGSNLSYLSGYFAGVIELTVSDQNLEKLVSALESMDELKITIHHCEHTLAEENQQIELVITGNDRKGIVQELTSVINHKGANIISFVSKHQSAPNWGGDLFNAIAKVSLPKDMDANVVIEALEHIATDIIVDVELEKAS